MNKEARNQYMETIRERYLKGSKKKKGEILDEYCGNTGQERKYVNKKFRYQAGLKDQREQRKARKEIYDGTVRTLLVETGQERKYVNKKFRYQAGLKDQREQRKARKEIYDGTVRTLLVEIWKIFDYPCGQRLVTILRTEIDRLISFKEISGSEETIKKLKKISSAEIDRSLKHEKEVLHNKNKYRKKQDAFLCSKVPTKTSAEILRDSPGRLQIDCVEHCGMSASGDYVNSLTIVDVFSGWWEGDAIMGKGQERALTAMDGARNCSPFSWLEMHPDNGGNLMNYSVYAYAEKNKIEFSRSRPYKKNDNCFVEQKNSTHVRKVVGYFRYDTEAERLIMSDLYRNELRLYKNFFQPVMKLVEKIRIAGKIHKRYDLPKTPYARLIESNLITEDKKQELLKAYGDSNPAELKRKIDEKLKKLYEVYRKKKGSSVETNQGTSKKLATSTV